MILIIIIIGIMSIIITIIIIGIIIIITIIILIVFWSTHPNTSLAMQTSQKETNPQTVEEWQLRYWCNQGDSAQNHRHDHQLVMVINNIRIHIRIIISIAMSMKNAITRPLLKVYDSH
jgi:energy-coupling factor transporter transmembrane protein EcfT